MSSQNQGVSLMRVGCKIAKVAEIRMDCLTSPLKERPQSPLKILYVEDDPHLRLCVGEALRRQGYEVRLATNGQEALELVSNGHFRPAVLLTDHEMPVMAGLELVDRLTRDGQRVPVVVYSGSLNEDLISAYRRLGVQQFAAKPSTPQELNRRLRQVLAL